MRSIVAVLAGYAVFAVSALLLFRFSGQDPHGDASATFKAMAILVGTAGAIIGGYVAGSLAKRSPVGHASALALLMAVIASWSLHASPVKAAIWTQVSALFFMAPAAILGGILCSRGRAGP